MSASVGEAGQEVELNLAPIIDCFTVMITYLLVTASFLTLTSVDVGVSATGAGAPPAESSGPPPWSMTLELKGGGLLALQLRGGPQSRELNFQVPTKNGVADLEGLNRQLQDIQKKYPSLNEVNVTAEPAIIYKDIISVIHEIQNVMPKVYISG